MIIHCVDCQTGFEFTEGEEKFYKEKGFEVPKRCPKCRARRKMEKMSEGDMHGKNRRSR